MTALRDIDAEVRPGTKEDALWFALGANRKNGRRLTESDKRHAIVLALEVWPERSGRDLAEQIGCSNDWVSKVRAEVSTSRHLPDRITGKDGKSYPATRKKAPAVADAPAVPRHAQHDAIAARLKAGETEFRP